MKLSLLLGLLLITNICFGHIFLNHFQPSKAAQLVEEVQIKAAEIIKKKYNIKPCGSGVAMSEGPIREIAICFDARGPYSKEKLREFLILFAHEIVATVQSNEGIQQYLFERPFGIKNVQIIIYNHDKTRREVCYPNISVAELSGNRLLYQSIDPNDTYNYIDQSEETYEEALEVLKKSKTEL